MPPFFFYSFSRTLLQFVMGLRGNSFFFFFFLHSVFYALTMSLLGDKNNLRKKKNGAADVFSMWMNYLGSRK